MIPYKTLFKRTLSNFLYLLIPIVSLGQEEVFQSTERDEYYAKRNADYKPFEPLSNDLILRFKNEFYDIGDYSNYSPYAESRYFTPYQDSIHALPPNLNVRDSREYKGNIAKNQILKYEKRGSIEAFVYSSVKFENRSFGENGIWVAYSSDDGLNWEYLYTGIVQRQPLFLKWYSNAPLLKTGNVLQIEAALLLQTAEFSHPGPGVRYDLVKDGLIVTMNLDVLRRDSDSDGLTDIVEAKFFTNRFSEDTDADGITDKYDLNPRFSIPRTDKTIIFESVIENNVNSFDTTGRGEFISSLSIPNRHIATDSTETILIVTDNADIHSIQPSSVRVIILTEKAYRESHSLFSDKLNRMYISPMFKVNNEVDTYLFTRSIDTWGQEYLVKKTVNGWIIRVISEWIS